MVLVWAFFNTVPCILYSGQALPLSGNVITVIQFSSLATAQFGFTVTIFRISMKLATLCYLKQDGHTLMMQRVKRENDIHYGKWNGLGGKFNAGETPEECVIREVREESGFTISSPRLRGLLTFPEFKDGEDWYVYLFTATTFSGSLQSCAEGNLAWILDTDVLSLPLWEGDQYFLRWLEEGRFFSAKFNYLNKQLVDHSVVFY